METAKGIISLITLFIAASFCFLNAMSSRGSRALQPITQKALTTRVTTYSPYHVTSHRLLRPISTLRAPQRVLSQAPLLQPQRRIISTSQPRYSLKSWLADMWDPSSLYKKAYDDLIREVGKAYPPFWTNVPEDKLKNMSPDKIKALKDKYEQELRNISDRLFSQYQHNRTPSLDDPGTGIGQFAQFYKNNFKQERARLQTQFGYKLYSQIPGAYLSEEGFSENPSILFRTDEFDQQLGEKIFKTISAQVPPTLRKFNETPGEIYQKFNTQYNQDKNEIFKQLYQEYLRQEKHEPSISRFEQPWKYVFQKTITTRLIPELEYNMYKETPGAYLSKETFREMYNSIYRHPHERPHWLDLPILPLFNVEKAIDVIKHWATVHIQTTSPTNLLEVINRLQNFTNNNFPPKSPAYDKAITLINALKERYKKYQL